MARIPAQAADQFGLFTAAQALQAGWSRAALTRAGASGRLERVRAGVYRRPDGTGCRAAATGSPGNHERLRTACKLAGAAAALKITGSVISHEAAAVIHELPLLG
ncbi:MAG: hypothetical protein JWO63_1499, partial [Frankiales bacterium]|nr:hypothetical protein [Frankiales bacterium]